ncbi:hypothetical protein WICPIJ_001605 [Wickerhamomyces pijperi]|uniref:Uncharacterized protein n=1 Tax=Wickerhamomyces pijperi TaxID=599730 RepID=A0A9P8QAN2_WICPI|nr:hypothetical protein WICPIJ_001605 [Wickerhamomyces pijperi]
MAEFPVSPLCSASLESTRSSELTYSGSESYLLFKSYNLDFRIEYSPSNKSSGMTNPHSRAALKHFFASAINFSISSEFIPAET